MSCTDSSERRQRRSDVGRARLATVPRATDRVRASDHLRPPRDGCLLTERRIAEPRDTVDDLLVVRGRRRLLAADPGGWYRRRSDARDVRRDPPGPRLGSDLEQPIRESGLVARLPLGPRAAGYEEDMRWTELWGTDEYARGIADWRAAERAGVVLEDFQPPSHDVAKIRAYARIDRNTASPDVAREVMRIGGRRTSADPPGRAHPRRPCRRGARRRRRGTSTSPV